MKQDEWVRIAEPQADEAEGGAQQPEQPEPEKQSEPSAALNSDAAGGLAALQAENRRCETRLFAYERLIETLQSENDALRRQCAALNAQVKSLKAAQRCAEYRPGEQGAPATPEQLEELSSGLLERLDDILTQK